MQNRDGLVEVEGGEFVHKTDNAVLLRYDDKKVWIPFSWLDDWSDDWKSVIMTGARAVEKGLDLYIKDTNIF